MRKLIAAELIKLTRQRVTFVLVGFFLGIGPIMAMLLVIWAVFGSLGDRMNSIEMMQYPRTLSNAAFAVARLGEFVGVIWVAGPLFPEMRHGMWDMLLPRQRSRTRPLMAKLLVSVVSLASLALASVALWVGAAAVAVSVLGERVATPEIVEAMPHLAPRWAAVAIATALLETGVSAGLVWCAVLISRSTVAGFAAGILAPLALWFVSGPSTMLYLPLTHVTNVFGRLAPAPEIVDRISLQCGSSIPAWVSVCVLVGYASTLVAAGVVVHARRDFKAR